MLTIPSFNLCIVSRITLWKCNSKLLECTFNSSVCFIFSDMDTHRTHLGYGSVMVKDQVLSAQHECPHLSTVQSSKVSMETKTAIKHTSPHILLQFLFIISGARRAR